MRCFRTVLALILTAGSWGSAPGADLAVTWKQLSTVTDDLPTPNEGDQQTCCVVFDIDGDGADDFVVGERTQAPSVVWYHLANGVWKKSIIDNTRLRPEAGGAAWDVDRDGDLDLILGQDSSGPDIWWWENPCPRFTQPWKRREIKNTGDRQHHDQTVADFDNDGRGELVSWNQRAKSLLWYELPDDPRSCSPWPVLTIYQWQAGQSHEGFPSLPVDVNLDGKLDVVGGGRWFLHQGESKFMPETVDESMCFTQCAAGQLVRGGRPEIVFSPGDADGEAKWYQWDGKSWKGTVLDTVVHGHTCEVRDINGDGNDDIFIGEMGSPGAGEKARLLIWYGNGRGKFQHQTVSVGQGIHEGLLGDFDGDGDLDILAKPYHHNAPRIDVFMNGR